MAIPGMMDPESMLAYARDWLEDANERWDIGHRSQAHESLREAAGIYVKLPPGYKDEEFEQYYQQTAKKLYP